MRRWHAGLRLSGLLGWAWTTLVGPVWAEPLRLQLAFGPDLAVVEDAQRQAAYFTRGGVPLRLLRDAQSGVRLGPATIQFEGGDASQRVAQIVADPLRPAGAVLEFAVARANVDLAIDTERETPGTTLPASLHRALRKARVQMNVYGNEGVAEIYQSVSMRLGDGFDVLASLPQPFDWLTLSEWWNNAGWTGEGHPFRISVDLTHPGGHRSGGLFLRAKATVKPPGGPQWSSTLWTVTASDWPLPVRQWMRVETWYREGDATHGRFAVAITPEDGVRRVLVDVHNVTRHPLLSDGDGLDHFNPLKLYTSQAVIDAVRTSAPRLAVQWSMLDIQACATGLPSPSPCERAMALR